MKRVIGLIALVLILATPVLAAKTKPAAAPAPAQKGAPPLLTKSKEPIEISAAKSLEWNRKDHTYTAHKSAIAKQGPFQISADMLVAKYSETPAKGGKAKQGGGMNIYEMTATDNVVIQDPPYTAYGDRAVYGVADMHATLTGQNLKVMTATESLTAKDSIEYFGQENRMVATGDAVAVKAPDTLKGDVLNAYFTKDAAGRTAMTKVTAKGHVTIITDKDTVYGDRGTYDIPTQKAVLTGKVKIYQGKNWLEGTRADVDMNTGISQLFADTTKGSEGRVTGTFYPAEQPETGKADAEKKQKP